MYYEIQRTVLGAILLILAITQTSRESYNMYKATKRWQPNRYMERLMRDGIIFFIVYVCVSPSLLYSPIHLALNYLQAN